MLAEARRGFSQRAGDKIWDCREILFPSIAFVERRRSYAQLTEWITHIVTGERRQEPTDILTLAVVTKQVGPIVSRSKGFWRVSKSFSQPTPRNKRLLPDR